MARRGIGGPLCVLGCVLVVTACGASSATDRGASGTSGGSGRVDPAVSLARCMRAHGVPSFPDPAAGGPPVIPNQINTNAPAFRSAQRTCGQQLSGGGVGGVGGVGGAGVKQSASQRLAMLAIARCIRAHGEPDFPDPTATPSDPRFRRAIEALGRGGLFLIIANPDAPAFKRAAAACHFHVPQPRSG